MNLCFNPPIPTVRELFLEYSGQLGIDLCFQNFQQELANLPDQYQTLIVAYEEDRPSGCIAIRPFDRDTAEMKRLYVREPYRGTGLGRLLTVTAIQNAKDLGYAAIRLDTLPTMESAIALYRSLRFRELSPPQAHGHVSLIYFQLDF